VIRLRLSYQDTIPRHYDTAQKLAKQTFVEHCGLVGFLFDFSFSSLLIFALPGKNQKGREREVKKEISSSSFH